MSLKLSFFTEGALPRDKRGLTPIKDEVVLLLLNFPCRIDEGFHEEGVLRLSFSLLHYLEELSSEIPIDSKVLPAGFAKIKDSRRKDGKQFLQYCCYKGHNYSYFLQASTFSFSSYFLYLFYP